MKKFLLRVVAFLFCSLFLDFGIGLWGDYLQNNTKGGDALRVNDLLKKDQFDLLFLGSSRTHHHYDTPFISDSLHLKAYNAGFDGNGVIMAYCVLQQNLKRYHPRMVILDVTPYVDMYTKGKEDYARYVSILKPYYRDPAIAEVLQDVEPAEWYKAHSGMIRYNTSIVPMTIGLIAGGGKDPYGFVSKNSVIAGDQPRGDKFGYEWDAKKFKYVRKIVQLAKEESVPLIIAVSPEYNYHFYQDIDSLRFLCRDYSVPLLDHYSDEDFIQRKDWFDDPTHLNGDGARVYSRKIVSEIKATFPSILNFE
ncbi:MAG: hypothetical protein K5849_02640 [Bacteroidales bacterium]|nr:hypothetical protein [Bacteroidales bacterium]